MPWGAAIGAAVGAAFPESACPHCGAWLASDRHICPRAPSQPSGRRLGALPSPWPNLYTPALAPLADVALGPGFSSPAPSYDPGPSFSSGGGGDFGGGGASGEF